MGRVGHISGCYCLSITPQAEHVFDAVPAVSEDVVDAVVDKSALFLGRQAIPHSGALLLMRGERHAGSCEKG